MSTYYYVYPFGQNADDLTAIPTSAAGDGSMSYYAGYTDPYEYDLLTNPNALPVARGSFNQLMFQATGNIQQYQQYGTPFWITSADNLGVPYAYAVSARVYYGGVVYENQLDGNTSTPGDNNTWLVISGNQSSFQAGMIMDWAGPTAPTDWALATGQAVSRSTYASLYANLTKTEMGTLTNTTYTVTGLSSTSGMYAGMYVEAIGIPAGTTIDSVDSDTQITLSQAATASGSEGIIFYYWGNGDGSTTFNLPNLQTTTTAGAGGSGYSFGAGLGQSGGNKTEVIASNMLPNHTHNQPEKGPYLQHDISTPLVTLADGNTLGVSYAGGNITGDLTGFTSQTPLPIIPPTILVNKIIRLV